jgi:hypothetical protein
MKIKTRIKYGIGLFLSALILTGCGTPQNSRDPKERGAARTDYLQLLAQFPEANQGRGLDNFLHVTDDQPMTYGLVLSAESFRYKKEPSKEGLRRIENAAHWLLQNSDLHHDGQPGWGLPQPWDAYADGSTNGPNQPYTILVTSIAR